MLTYNKSLLLFAVVLVTGCGTACIVPNRAEIAALYTVSESKVASPELETLLIEVRKTVDCLMDDPGNVCGLKFNIFRRNRDINATGFFRGNEIERILREASENGDEITVEFPWASDGSGFGVLIFREKSGKFSAEAATIALP